MGTTVRDTNLYTDLLQEAISGELAGMDVLYGSRAAVVQMTLPRNGPNGPYKGGDKVVVPYFDFVGELEDLAEGGALTPSALTSTNEEASIVHSGKAGEVTSWAQMAASVGDPYGEYAKQFARAFKRRIERALLSAAITSLPSTNILDITGEASPGIGRNPLLRAQALWGDEQSGIVLMSMHSKVYFDALQLVDSSGQPIFKEIVEAGPNGGEAIRKLNGIPVAISDLNTKSGTTYSTLLFKEAALAAWVNGAPIVKGDSDILADTEVTAIHAYHVAHRYKRRPGWTLPGVIKLQTTQA